MRGILPLLPGPVALAALALVLLSPRAARCQSGGAIEIGDVAIFELHDGTLIKGELLDKLPDGYLVRESNKDASRVLRYESVKEYLLVERASPPRRGPTTTSQTDEAKPPDRAADSPEPAPPTRWFEVRDLVDGTSHRLVRGGTPTSSLPVALFPASRDRFVLYDQDGAAYDIAAFYGAVGKGRWFDQRVASIRGSFRASRVLAISGLGLVGAGTLVTALHLAGGGRALSSPGGVLQVIGLFVAIPALATLRAARDLERTLFDPATIHQAASAWSARTAGLGSPAGPGLAAVR